MENPTQKTTAYLCLTVYVGPDIVNMPYRLRASYENETTSYYAENMNPQGQMEFGDSPKISCDRNGDTML
ncbi:hypothetical protein [Petroclostridium sp. X23]|jgi:hypothetical protein|uniref:hypothetical protein n=1 Tax=Petroclostridium sp. X23 TaxID=3045146 RepID=UPI0024ADC3C4|nr:hypothetical protein [Petroclostridium sp. X23]WHH61330.1 hypothetical protein QKW49_11775 [Petroclostridium sp. X23]